MSSRGDYRAVYSVLYDSDEYKRLSKDAKLLWHGVKHCLGLSGIDVVYDEQLAERSGLEVHEVAPARQELIREKWIEVEGRVHWLINGLRFEPNVSVSNPNHVKAIGRHLVGMPKLQIVNRMASYYGLPIPFPNPSTIPPPQGIGDGNGNHGAVDVKPLTEAVDGDEERARESRARGSAAPDVDSFTPNDEHRALAAELGFNVATLLVDWRLQRKATGTTPADLDADFERWIRRELQYANGNGASAPPADTGVVKRWEPPPRDDGPEPTPEEREAGRELVRQAMAAKADTPAPRKKRLQPPPRDEQLEAARAKIAAEKAAGVPTA